MQHQNTPYPYPYPQKTHTHECRYGFPQVGVWVALEIPLVHSMGSETHMDMWVWVWKPIQVHRYGYGPSWRHLPQTRTHAMGQAGSVSVQAWFQWTDAKHQNHAQMGIVSIFGGWGGWRTDGPLPLTFRAREGDGGLCRRELQHNEQGSPPACCIKKGCKVMGRAPGLLH